MPDAIEWPAGFDRTPAHEREPNNRFDTGLRPSIDDLAAELERVGVDDWRLSTAAQHQKQNPRYPYADSNPDDPGAVVRWTMDGEQYAAACDAYTRLRDNIRALYLYIKEKRKMENRPVRTGASEFANARLPPGDEDAETIVAGGRVQQPPHEVLGISPDAPEPVVKGAFRELVKEAHADQGANAAYDVSELKEARDELLAE